MHFAETHNLAVFSRSIVFRRRVSSSISCQIAFQHNGLLQVTVQRVRGASTKPVVTSHLICLTACQEEHVLWSLACPVWPVPSAVQVQSHPGARPCVCLTPCACGLWSVEGDETRTRRDGITEKAGVPASRRGVMIF